MKTNKELKSTIAQLNTQLQKKNIEIEQLKKEIASCDAVTHSHGKG